MRDYEISYWNRCIDFHGHACPGLAIGFKAAMLAKEILEISDNMGDEEIVCFSETEACSVDAIQAVLKATVGSGSLKITYKGKNAFSFYNRLNGKSIRLVFKQEIDAPSKNDKMQRILESDPRVLFDIKNVTEPFPLKAQIYGTRFCSKCGEMTAKNALNEIDGMFFCFDCRSR